MLEPALGGVTAGCAGVAAAGLDGLSD